MKKPSDADKKRAETMVMETMDSRSAADFSRVAEMYRVGAAMIESIASAIGRERFERFQATNHVLTDAMLNWASLGGIQIEMEDCGLRVDQEGRVWADIGASSGVAGQGTRGK